MCTATFSAERSQWLWWGPDWLW